MITYKKAIPSDFETLASICIEAMRPDLRKRDPYDLEQLDIIESEQLDGPELEQTDEINSEQFDIMDSAQTDTYDPEQERERFKKSFVPDLTIVSLFHEQITGFYMMTEEKDRIVVNHLCVDPQFQNNGFGTQMMKRIIAKYNQTYKPIYVEVPRNSKANVFFQRHGFKMIKELESSIIYVFPF